MAWPDAATLQSLQDVVQLGYYRGIMDLLDQIDSGQPGCAEFVAQVRPLARQFQFEAIGRLLAPALGASTISPP
jgi:hypothetical protein